jgi:hypothetical protein
MLCREPSGASGFGKRPCLAWPGFAALIGSGEFEEDANVPLKIGLRPVKVEVAYGNPGVFAAKLSGKNLWFIGKATAGSALLPATPGAAWIFGGPLDFDPTAVEVGCPPDRPVRSGK